MHPRNQHYSKTKSAYDFAKLTKANPELRPFVKVIHGKQTIEFANPDAIRELNRALLIAYYDLNFWQLPSSNLCPPVPGRADYIHHLADLLAQSNSGDIPTGKQYTGIDIGCGASLIYPIIGNKEYGWKFIGSDIDKKSIDWAKLLIKSNSKLDKNITVVHQTNKNGFFQNVLNHQHRYLFSMCNPPFYTSKQHAQTANSTKTHNLKIKPNQNFSGNQNELIFPGGEAEFVCKMMVESSQHQTQVLWFTSLVAHKTSLKKITKQAKLLPIKDYQIIDMHQGNKISRFFAWSYLTDQQRREWFTNSR